jgi:hypothetical protein
MSAFHTMKDEHDALEEKVDELERENRLMRKQYFRRLEERDALKESVKDLLDLTEYGDIDGVVWELVNDGDEWVVERLNRAQALIDSAGFRTEVSDGIGVRVPGMRERRHRDCDVGQPEYESVK